MVNCTFPGLGLGARRIHAEILYPFCQSGGSASGLVMGSYQKLQLESCRVSHMVSQRLNIV